MSNNIPAPQFLPEVGDPTGGFVWLAPDTVAAGDVAPVKFSEPDTSSLPMAGPGVCTWGAA